MILRHVLTFLRQQCCRGRTSRCSFHFCHRRRFLARLAFSHLYIAVSLDIFPPFFLGTSNLPDWGANAVFAFNIFCCTFSSNSAWLLLLSFTVYQDGLPRLLWSPPPPTHTKCYRAPVAWLPVANPALHRGSGQGQQHRLLRTD